MLLLSNKHIFITEDNPLNRVLFQMTLLRYGATVEFERWGRDTLPRLRREARVHLVILDLMLAEGWSGYDIFKAIREVPAFDAVPIIACSSADPRDSIARAQSMGFSGFIAKPINIDLFPQQIANVIKGDQVWYDGVTDRFEKPTEPKDSHKQLDGSGTINSVSVNL